MSFAHFQAAGDDSNSTKGSEGTEDGVSQDVPDYLPPPPGQSEQEVEEQAQQNETLLPAVPEPDDPSENTADSDVPMPPGVDDQQDSAPMEVEDVAPEPSEAPPGTEASEPPTAEADTVPPAGERFNEASPEQAQPATPDELEPPSPGEPDKPFEAGDPPSPKPPEETAEDAEPPSPGPPEAPADEDDPPSPGSPEPPAPPPLTEESSRQELTTVQDDAEESADAAAGVPAVQAGDASPGEKMDTQEIEDDVVNKTNEADRGAEVSQEASRESQDSRASSDSRDVNEEAHIRADDYEERRSLPRRHDRDEMENDTVQTPPHRRQVRSVDIIYYYIGLFKALFCVSYVS